MKETKHIKILARDDALRASLMEVFPQGFEGKASFYCDLIRGDENLSRVESVLHDEFGMKPWDTIGTKDKKKEYTLDISREYDESDLIDFEYVNPYAPFPELLAGGVYDGVRRVGGKDMLEDRDIYLTLYGIIILPDRTKRLLEQEAWIGLDFKEVDINLNSGNPLNFHRKARSDIFDAAPYWEVVPTVCLPPLSPSMHLTDQDGNALLPGDESGNYVAREGNYNFAELRYRRSDLSALPYFDGAHTIEHFAVSSRTVLSNRFYRFCVENDIQGKWAPVHVEEDADS